MRDGTLGAYNIADLREIARRKLPKGIFEFIVAAATCSRRSRSARRRC